MTVYRAEISDSSFRVKRWKQLSGGLWIDAKSVEPIDFQKTWDINTRSIMFQAHHWSSIVAALRAMSSTKFLIPSGPVVIGHQYWVSKQHRSHQLATITRPASRAFAEKANHVHKVAIWKGHVGSMNSFTQLFKQELSQPTEWSASRVAEKIEASGDLIGRAPNVAQDAIEEMISALTMVANIFV